MGEARLQKKCATALVAALAGLGLGLAGGGAAFGQSRCQLQQAAELHLDVEGNRGLIEAEINGQKVRFLADTGASTSTLFRRAAERLGVPMTYVGSRLQMYGVGGPVRSEQAVMQTLKLGNMTLTNANMLVMGPGASTMDRRPLDVVGLIGRDLFSQWDVEVDIAHNAIRLLTPKDCQGDQVVYWRSAYSVAQLVAENNASRAFGGYRVQVALDGRPLTALLDTGAFTSVVAEYEASRLGITPQTPGVVPAGTARGVGPEAVQAWVAPFNSFSFGDETIRNPRIRMADLFHAVTTTELGSRVPEKAMDTPGMLVGFDFFRAHRVLIANSQGKVYVSYVGGPVFSADPSATTAAAAPPPASPAAGAPR